MHELGPPRAKETHPTHALLRDMDLVAPRVVHARVHINGECQGLFSAVEQVDGRFTANRSSASGDGNLYRDLWPFAESTPADVEKALRTSDDPGNVNVSDFMAFTARPRGAVLDHVEPRERKRAARLGAQLDQDPEAAKEASRVADRHGRWPTPSIAALGPSAADTLGQTASASRALEELGGIRADSWLRVHEPSAVCPIGASVSRHSRFPRAKPPS